MFASLSDAAADVLGLAIRLARRRAAARRVGYLPGRGFCHSCGRQAFFLVADNRWLIKAMEGWPYEEAVLTALATRENYLCVWCGRNFRMRQLAAVAETAIQQAVVYEPATFGVFSNHRQRGARAYITSEYFDGAAPGAMIRDRRNEDITALTFADGSFDVVITSELFEHVDDPWRGFAEVHRVLRMGGRHFFTVPVVEGQPTRSRAGLPSVYHVDPIRRGGIAVKTDFGLDLPELLGQLGFRTEVYAFPQDRPVARVFVSEAF